MLSPLESAEGILVTAAIRDITSRKTAETHLLQKVEELNRSNEELGQFAYIASHDLQEPLRMVASYTQLLSRRYKGKLDADADEFIAFAVDGASRMQRLIQDLLAILACRYQRARTLSISPAKTLCNKRSSIFAAPSQKAARRSRTIRCRLFLRTRCNSSSYFKISSATPSSTKAPEFRRYTSPPSMNGGKKWMFSVKDNGLGIDPQYFEKIFGMFQRLHKREEFAGTGIGLAICKKIVERHGGTISVESQLGQGSTFRFAMAGKRDEIMKAHRRRRYVDRSSFG